MRISRRSLLKGAAAAAIAAALPSCGSRRRISGGIVDQSDDRGHRLLSSGPLAEAGPVETTRVAIAGGGIAGLSAAWALARAGFPDFTLLEMEDALGGTSASGENSVSRFPWAAHYVPVPTREQRTLSLLLTEVGAIRGFDAKGRAIPDEATLVRDPEERLFLAGAWHEGLYPREGATADDLRELERFEAEMRAFAARRDAKGRRAFAIPTTASARDEDLLALDRVSMADWMRSKGFSSPRLRWYAEYACRDDFGCLLDTTSAWAGIHYFASRIAFPGDDPAAFLTWPEGNGFLVRHLAKSAQTQTRTGTLVLSVEPEGGSVLVTWLDLASGKTRRMRAERVIAAMPRFAARRVVRGLSGEREGFRTSPWVMANVTLDGLVRSHGFPIAWDNVVYDSESLGYVVATHQTDRRQRDSVWTWYRPFPGPDPAAERERVARATWEDWRDAVLADLVPAHEDFAERVVSIDVRRFGHAMVRPEPGFLWGDARRRAAQPLGPVHFAAADLGGLPLFEEAQWAGVRAAEEVMASLGHSFESAL